MLLIDEIFGNHETNVSIEELQFERSGYAQERPKAEISKDSTIIFTEQARFWEGMK